MRSGGKRRKKNGIKLIRRVTNENVFESFTFAVFGRFNISMGFYTHTQCVIKLFFFSLRLIGLSSDILLIEGRAILKEEAEKKSEEKTVILFAATSLFQFTDMGLSIVNLLNQMNARAATAAAAEKKNLPFHFQKLYFLFFSLCVKFLAQIFLFLPFRIRHYLQLCSIFRHGDRANNGKISEQIVGKK